MTGCLDENVIGALFDHRLSKAEVDAIDEHTAKCAECRDLLCGLARLYSSPSSPSPSRAFVRTAPLRDPRLAAGASAPSVAHSLNGVAIDEANIRRLLALLGCERMVGKVLCGKWRLDGVLGVGGMAEVYAATHLSNGRRAAIKLLRREWLTRPNVVFRFLREGYVANRLNHPGAVAILDDGTTDSGNPFLVLEYLEGRTIASNVRERLPIPTVLWIASQILDVLSAAHDQQIVHRDIKPENVFLTRDGAVKVLDFGIARMRALAENGTPGNRHTQHGTMMGTPGYMPPEQARGRLDEIDARSDLWSLGATMFALLAGRPVRGNATPNETLVAAMTEPAPRLSTVNPAIAPAICDIVDRALAFRREDRWDNARQMQAAIRDVQARRDGSRPSFASFSTAPPMVTSVDVPPPPKRTSTAGVLMSLLGVIGFVALASAGIYARARLVRTEHANVASSTHITSAVVPTASEVHSDSHVPPIVAAPSSRPTPASVSASTPRPVRRAPARRSEVAPETTHASPPPPPPPSSTPSPPKEDPHPLDRRN